MDLQLIVSAAKLTEILSKWVSEQVLKQHGKITSMVMKTDTGIYDVKDIQVRIQIEEPNVVVADKVGT